jgi:hypothetical protein
VQKTLRLVRFSDTISPTPQSWDLDPLTIKPGFDPYGFIDVCESVYVSAFVARKLSIDLENISRLLFGTADKQPRVAQLLSLVTSKANGQTDATKKAQAWQLPSRITQSVALQAILHELDAYHVEGELTLESALQASEEGMRTRGSDFEQAKYHFLRSAKIIYRLLQQEAPGASPVDLEWQLSSYCAAAAGAAFFRRNYGAAIDYYLAFFSLVVETEPVWEKVERLVPSMLSFYFSNAAFLQAVSLDVSPGQKRPAYIVNLVLNHTNLQVRECGIDLARKLAEVNPTQLRKIIQRLEDIASQGTGEDRPEEKSARILVEIFEASTDHSRTSGA